MLPDYIAKAVPNPTSNRAPWYANTAPSYAGVFLWVVFYMQLAVGTLDRANPWLLVGALVVAGVLSYKLYYYVPGMLGMKTGYPLYVVGSSTFGTLGGYVMPGLLMGLLQIGWFSVGTFVSTNFILNGLGIHAGPGSLPFLVVAALWTYIMGYVGVKGIGYVSRVSLYLNAIPVLMVLIVMFQTAGGVTRYTPAQSDSYGAFMLVVAAAIGFFATAGAAGGELRM